MTLDAVATRREHLDAGALLLATLAVGGVAVAVALAVVADDAVLRRVRRVFDVARRLARSVRQAASSCSIKSGMHSPHSYCTCYSA